MFLADDGSVVAKKIPSSVDDYAQAIVAGLAALFDEQTIAAPQIAEILHGTTIASNAILELKGARVV